MPPRAPLRPPGRAYAGYLLELQLAVAEALGVQLIYTTGLFDADALSVFPLIIRLRNDAELRAGLKYLSVDTVVHHELTALCEPDGTARLGAGVPAPGRADVRLVATGMSPRAERLAELMRTWPRTRLPLQHLWRLLDEADRPVAPTRGAA